MADLLNVGSWGKRLVQSGLDRLLERFPLERLWSQGPLIILTEQVLAMDEVRDAMEALQVKRAEVITQVAKQRKTIGQVTQRFP